MKKSVRKSAAAVCMCVVLLAGCAGREAADPQPAPVTAEAKPPQASGERVSFDSIDIDPGTRRPVRINALLFAPEGDGPARRPAVVALHGCGGMYSILKSKRDALSMRHQGMADLLVAQGYIVLFPDSFRSRGTEEICTVEDRARTITQRNRLLDTLAALAFLQQRPDVLPDRVAVLGWSHGGSAVLAALNRKDERVNERVSLHDPYFRAGVAFYPGCRDSLKARPGYALAAPLELFIAGSDDWTAPGPCVQLAEKLKAATGPAVGITIYPDTFHGFDGPGNEPKRRLEVPNGVHPGKGVTVAPNPAARADAYARLKRFLAERIGP